MKTARSESIKVDSPNHLSTASSSPCLDHPVMTGPDSSLLAHIGVGVIMVDAAGHITCANEKAASLLCISFGLLSPGSAYADLKQQVLDINQPAGNETGLPHDLCPWQEDLAKHGLRDVHVSDGAIIEIRSSALPEGGSIHTLTDVGHDRRLRAKLHRLATTDSLTGVANRRRFIDTCQIEIDRARRYGCDVALMVLDLDHFKGINDLHGHAVGDATLTSVSTTSVSSIRTVDLFGRLGGEEFGVLLPETDIETAAIVAERLRQSIAAHPIHVAPETTVYVTASIGITIIRPEDATPDPALARADSALYRAKGRGRNRIDISY